MVDEKLSGAEEAEYGRLQDSVARMESLLVAGAFEGKAMGMLRLFVENAKQRMVALERHSEHKAEEEKEAGAREIGIRYLVEREQALNAIERQEYAGLLSHEYFTKSDFGQLEHFYSHGWHKLTEAGKDEMSYRVWEGVRHGEYKFSKLPDGMKENEAERVQIVLQRAEKAGEGMNVIPETDRTDFLRARGNGDRGQSYLILDRPSFTEHMATKVYVVSTAQNEAVDSSLTLRTADKKPVQPALEPVAAHEVCSNKLDLTALQEVDGSSANFPPPLASASGSTAKGRGQ